MTLSSPKTATAIRDDIQILRSVAILLVLAHHAGISALPGGFLGVDLFFVISGFLMGRQIDKKLIDGSFRFSDFYARRARRLLPASYATLTATAVAAPLLLDSVEYNLFLKQLAGAVTFVANIVLWKQSDYFSTGAELKPLLHMWSLAVEEQFYLGLPLLLFLLPARWRMAAVAAATCMSLLLCLWLLPRAPSATFYMLPTRAWELGLGVLVALATSRNLLPERPMPAIRLSAGATILVTSALFGQAGHPGVAALIMCLAASLLVLPGSSFVAHGPGRLLTAVGDRSYSLYLVHWPLFAFANNLYADAVPLPIRMVLLLCCFPLAEFQYRLIEHPLRRIQITPKAVTLLVAVPVLIVGMGYGFTLLRPAPVIAQDRQPNLGLSTQCAFTDRLIAQPPCTSGIAPDTLVWGDSFAMHVVPGIAAHAPQGIVQATKTVCGPFSGIAPVDTQSHQAHWARECMAFNDDVLRYIRQHPNIRTVILSSILIPYLMQESGSDWRILRQTKKGEQISPQSPALLLSALTETVARIRAAGRTVLLIGPPPGTETDFSRCQLRHAEGLSVLGRHANCRFSRADYERERQPILDFLNAASPIKGLSIIRLEPALCPDGLCQTRKGNVILYADHGHLSVRGSRLLADQMRWADSIRKAGSATGAAERP